MDGRRDRPAVAAAYRDARARLLAHLAAGEREDARFAAARLVTAGVALALGTGAFALGRWSGWWLLAPAVAFAALAVMHAEPERVERLRQNGTLFLATAKKLGLDTGFSLGLAVVPIIVGDSLKAVTLSDRLFRRGINVQPIIHPAVPERASRLRFFITSEHTAEQIKDTVNAIADELKTLETGSSLIEQLMARRGS